MWKEWTHTGDGYTYRARKASTYLGREETSFRGVVIQFLQGRSWVTVYAAFPDVIDEAIRLLDDTVPNAL